MTKDSDPPEARSDAQSENTQGDVTDSETNAMRVWREASKLFSGLRYGLSNPLDGWFQTRRQLGDTITSSKKLKYWRKLRTLTDTLNDAELEYIRFLSQQRLEFTSAIFRMNAVMSVTLPISAAVVANQLYPGVVQDFIADSPIILTVVFAMFLVTIGLVFGNVFKARELRMALELEAARRRLLNGDASEHAGSPASEFDFDLPTT